MFIDRLNELIEEKKLTRTKVFKDLGIGKNSVYYWQSGALPNASTINALAEYFGVSTDFLLDKEKIKKPDAGKSDELNNSVDDVLTRIAMGLFAGLPVNDKRLAIDLIERLSEAKDKK